MYNTHHLNTADNASFIIKRQNSETYFIQHNNAIILVCCCSQKVDFIPQMSLYVTF